MSQELRSGKYSKPIMQLLSYLLLLLPALAISTPFLQPDSHDKASDSNYDKGVDKHVDKASDNNYDKGVDKFVDNAEKVEKLLALESVSLDIASNIYDQEVAWLNKYEKETVIPDQAIDEELEKLRELVIVRFWQEAELEKQKALHNELAGREVYDLLSNVQKLALNYLAG